VRSNPLSDTQSLELDGWGVARPATSNQQLSPSKQGEFPDLSIINLQSVEKNKWLKSRQQR
jgi:hypothetical protein